MGISIGTSLGLDAHPTVRTIGHWLAAGSIANYWIVEARWFSRVLRIGLLPAIGNVCLGLLEGTIFLIAVGFLFTR